MGFLFSLASAVLSASKDLISKGLAYKLDGTLSTFASFAYALPFYVVLLVVVQSLGLETWVWVTNFWLLVLLRSITDVFAEGMKMHALAHGDISIVALFFSLSPVLLMISSPVLTDEPITSFQAGAIALTVTGSLIVAYRPGQRTLREQKTAIFLALGAAFFFSLNSSFDRLAARDFKVPVLSSFAMTLFSAILVAPFIPWRGETLATLNRNRNGLWLRGLLEAVFMTFKLVAIQTLGAVEVIAVQRLSVVFAVLGGRFLYGEPDFPRRFVASMFIVAGAVVVMIGKFSAVTSAAAGAP